MCSMNWIWANNIMPIGIAVCAINLPFMIWAVTGSVNGLDPDLDEHVLPGGVRGGAHDVHRFAGDGVSEGVSAADHLVGLLPDCRLSSVVATTVRAVARSDLRVGTRRPC